MDHNHIFYLLQLSALNSIADLSTGLDAGLSVALWVKANNSAKRTILEAANWLIKVQDTGVEVRGILP